MRFALGIACTLVAASIGCKSASPSDSPSDSTLLTNPNTTNLMNQDSAVKSYVSVQNGRFQLDGAPFMFVGSNFYRLGLSDAFKSHVIKENKNGINSYPQIDKVFENYFQEGFKVVRLWGFSCGGDHIKGPQIINDDLSINEQGIDQLDYAIASAGKHGIRVILPTINFEHEYCGMAWWVDHILDHEDHQQGLSWACLNTNSKQIIKLVYDRQECLALSSQGNPVEARIPKEYFYSDIRVKDAYQKYLKTFLNRSNPYSGWKYRDDPAIFAIELTNEIHTSDFYECLISDIGKKTARDCSQESLAPYHPGSLVNHWLDEMSTFVKTIDQRHLLSSGEEGYRASHQNSECANHYSWINNGMKGIDFALNAQLKNIDFMTTHLYPDNWAISPTDLGWFNTCVVQDLGALAAKNGKPIILEETGFSDQGYPGKPKDYLLDRAYYLSRMYRYANQAHFQGTMVWQASPLTVGDQVAESDTFTFPIKEKRQDKYLYSPEGMTMLNQIKCQNSMLKGAKFDSCAYTCPRGTSVNNHQLGYDQEGFLCYLP